MHRQQQHHKAPPSLLCYECYARQAGTRRRKCSAHLCAGVSTHVDTHVLLQHLLLQELELLCVQLQDAVVDCRQGCG